jgi:phosphoribosyl 1,2-cyclic phosphodiesterase
MTGEGRFTIKFRGVRGGYPMPGPTTVRYGGNTTCFEVRAGPHLIIVDVGTGGIELGREMVAHHQETGEPIRATLLLTHLHHDHTQGLPFFRPFLHPKAKLSIFGAKPGRENTLEKALIHDIQPPVFPLGLEELYSQREIHHIRGGDRIVLIDPAEPPSLVSVHDELSELPPHAVVVRVHHGYHHPQEGVLMFRIQYRERSLVIATDTEGYFNTDRRLIKFARGTDLLIHDAEYDEHDYADQMPIRQGWGHSTWRMAVEVAQAAEVKQLVLFHHSPAHSDDYLDEMLVRAQAVFAETIMAQEGWVVSLL